MKITTRMILRQVASRNIKLTPRLLQVLKELEPDQRDASAVKNIKTPVTPLKRRKVKAFADEKRLTFVSPLPGKWIRRTGCVAGLVFFLVISFSRAASGASIIDPANNASAPGLDSQTANGYEAITAQQGFSAPVLFNLANAQQSDGQLGRAILNYERAALLSPNDADIAANLRVARQKAGVEIEHSSPFQMAAHTLTMNTWFALAAVASFLFALTWPLKPLYPRARRALNIGCICAALVLAVDVGVLGLRSLELDRAVVVAPEAVAGVSPVTMAEPLFKLLAGEIVTLQQTYGNFALVRNHIGQEGWVNTDKIEQIIPARKI